MKKLAPFSLPFNPSSTEGDGGGGGGERAAYMYLHVVLLLLYQSIRVHDVKYAASYLMFLTRIHRFSQIETSVYDRLKYTSNAESNSSGPV